MNPGTTFAKTDKGKVEMAERSGNLTAVQRRLLILIDGKKSESELSAFARGGELDDALEHLLRLGLVEPTSQLAALQPIAAEGFVAALVTEPPRAATSVAEFQMVRDEASRFVADRLGEAGAPISAAIDRCASPAELRKLLRGIEIFVGQRLSPETARTFVQRFGALLL
ncbi:MAG: hypothetical protein IPO43_01770 [Rhodoferax sp.]|nr:hypothetical protein [Rhodoferax sp.]